MSNEKNNTQSSSDAFAGLFADLQAYATAEAEINQEQWAFTHRCTAHVREKFTTLQTQATESLNAVEENRQLLARLPAEFGSQLDELERHLANMEAVVKNLDAYSAALERRYLTPSS